MPLGEGCAETLNKASMLKFKAISDLYKKSLPIFSPLTSIYLKKSTCGERLRNTFQRSLQTSLRSSSLNLAQPYSNFTKRLPVVNRFEVMLDQGFRSIFRRSPWIILVGRIFSLPLAQHCSEFTYKDCL